MTGRVDRSRSLADLEMKLRRADAPRLADPADDLTAFHDVPALDQQRLVVRVGRDPPAGVADHEEVSEAAQLVAGVGDDAVVRRAHGLASGGGDVDAVVVPSASLGAVAVHDTPLDGPDEQGAAPWRRRPDGAAPRFAPRFTHGRLAAGRRLPRRVRGRGGQPGAGREPQLLVRTYRVGRLQLVEPGQARHVDAVTPGNPVERLALADRVAPGRRNRQLLSGSQGERRLQVVRRDDGPERNAGAPRDPPDRVALLHDEAGDLAGGGRGVRRTPVRGGETGHALVFQGRRRRPRTGGRAQDQDQAENPEPSATRSAARRPQPRGIAQFISGRTFRHPLAEGRARHAVASPACRSRRYPAPTGRP